MVLVVLTTVLELLFDTTAHNDPIIRQYRYVSIIEKPMQILPKKEAVGNDMRSIAAIGFDMSGIKHGESPLSCNCAPSCIGLGYQDPKRTLP
jgi:hypothetical protein